ncbi:uncharacterized protein PV07_09170 [Cladophialophora immunda]|uniref:Uncharacterized protein n=1 Tax=Cladophialophora immunda TaxID=569365 RepID=A0A0D1ZEC2_9EURO|nr:uncharacterized protein PV07_09170 [Cladophialophora immunda]KIW26041.1 hypothetical protein PV07_09170 [Cladophialophora immunda]OQU97996.1 hypothetical protein CLAIMM_03839 [Cladophialophora immunda]
MSYRMAGWALAIGFGVLNGYMTFRPAFEARALEKLKEEERAASELGPNMIEIPTQASDNPISSGRNTLDARPNE